MRPLTLTVAQVAARLGMSRAAFYRRLPELERDGLPPPLGGAFGSRRGAEQVRAWIEVRHKAAELARDTANDDGPPRQALAADPWEAELLRRMARKE